MLFPTALLAQCGALVAYSVSRLGGGPLNATACDVERTRLQSISPGIRSFATAHASGSVQNPLQGQSTMAPANSDTSDVNIQRGWGDWVATQVSRKNRVLPLVATKVAADSHAYDSLARGFDANAPVYSLPDGTDVTVGHQTHHTSNGGHRRHMKHDHSLLSSSISPDARDYLSRSLRSRQIEPESQARFGDAASRARAAYASKSEAASFARAPVRESRRTVRSNFVLPPKVRWSHKRSGVLDQNLRSGRAPNVNYTVGDLDEHYLHWSTIS